ncbi:Uncharacterised protein [Shigella sonnei]|nr:Uncharacterised protein [Shigella sonnei]CSG17060.1 Uncharacterised protein [Shigella sonnei]
MTLLQQTFHTVGKLRFGDLASVGWTDRRNVIGIVQTGLQERDLSVEFQPMNIKE